VNDDFVAHGKDCVKALRAKLTAPTKGRAVMDADATLKALFALEMCMKNCGGRFHAMAVAKEVPETMVRLCERAPNLEVRDKTLALVHEWAVNLRREPAFAGAFHQLRARGFQFPEVERRSVARGATSSAAREDWNGGGDWSKREDISEEDRAAIARALEEDEEEAMTPVQRQRHGIYPGNIAMGTPVRAPHLSSPPASGRLADRAESELQRALRESERTAAAEASRATTSVSKTYNSQDVEKLKGDIAVATNSLKVFTQVLDGCVALRPPSPSSLANELSEQCRAMQPRLIELISNAEDEGLLASAIHLNDELTKEMERYDLLVKAAAGDVASRARLAAPVAATRTHTAESLLSELDDVMRASTAATTTSQSSANPFGDVLPTASIAGPSSSSSNPFAAGPTPPRPIVHFPSTTSPSPPPMQTNPMFADERYRPARPLPEGMRPMNPAAFARDSLSPPTPSRAAPSRSPASDPFADLSQAAASRVRSPSRNLPHI
tara:strand:+ start:1578 stop:3065 length:1488 start_codon:yes stop_codon:yes gene_type:complete